MREVERLRSLLTQSATRLITLTGAPGIGKTRLALAVGEKLQGDFEDGVHFVPLDALTDPTLVADTVARSLGLSVPSGKEVEEALREHLREKAALLLLDNFEQIVDAALTVANLLATAPRLKVLVTSRVPLRLRGEKEIPVPPLALPDVSRPLSPDELDEVASVTLFVERAQDVKDDFALTPANAATVAAICMQLEGLPLAIELAAARIRLLSPVDLLSRLARPLSVLTEGPRDLSPRQQTLRNAIQSSYDLLSPGEQRLFRELGVFVGPFSAGEAEEVASASLDGLAALLDSSLLRVHNYAAVEEDETYYSMLVVVREFALEELTRLGELGTVQRRHAEYLVRLADGARIELQGGEQSKWMARLARVHDDIRAALSWALSAGETETALLIGGGIWRFWLVRGPTIEGRQWLARALAEDAGASTPTARGRALAALGRLAFAQADLNDSDKALLEALALFRETGDRFDISQALNNLGLVAHAQGNDEQALRYLTEGANMRREIGDKAGLGASLSNLGMIAYGQHDYAGARRYLEESISLHRDRNDFIGQGISLGNVGTVALAQGDFSAARHYTEEALGISRRLGDKQAMAFACGVLGQVARKVGDRAEAERLTGEALGYFQELGYRQGIAEAMEEFALLAAHAGEPARAALLAGHAARVRAATGTTKDAPNVEEYERALQLAKSGLPADAWDRSFEDGRAMATSEAVACALREVGASSV